MKNNTKMITILGVLTALYVVMSAFLKFTLFSNIMVDLGYVVFTVALCMYGVYPLSFLSTFLLGEILFLLTLKKKSK